MMPRNDLAFFAALAVDTAVRQGYERAVMEQYASRLVDHITFVREAGRKIGVDSTLLEAHDLSKWSNEEFTGYAMHFCGGGSPLRFAQAWLHHIHHNPHHWQHYLFADGFSLPGSGIIDGALPMPEEYALEMVADWMGASRVYTGDWDMTAWLAVNWKKVRLHPATRLYVAEVLSGIGYASILGE